jgi:hypothetical protein
MDVRKVALKSYYMHVYVDVDGVSSSNDKITNKAPHNPINHVPLQNSIVCLVHLPKEKYISNLSYFVDDSMMYFFFEN